MAVESESDRRTPQNDRKALLRSILIVCAGSSFSVMGVGVADSFKLDHQKREAADIANELIVPPSEGELRLATESIMELLSEHDSIEIEEAIEVIGKEESHQLLREELLESKSDNLRTVRNFVLTGAGSLAGLASVVGFGATFRKKSQVK